MPNNEVIGASIQVNSGSSNANIKEVNKNLKDVKQSLADTGQAAVKTSKEVEGAGGSFSKIKEQMGALPGVGGQAAEGVGKLGSAFKALLANPIVALIAGIVAGLTLLYKAFTSTNDGADKMEQIFSGLGAAVEVIAKRILAFAGSIVDFFKGNWQAAADGAKAAFAGFGDEITREFTKASEATKLLQEVEDATRSLSESRAKLNRDLAASKELITDENATLAQKKKAIDAVREAEGKQTEQELANAIKKRDALQQKAGVDISDDEADQISAANQAIYQLQEKSANDIRSLNKQSRAIEKQAREKEKEERTAAIQKEKEERQQLVEFTNKLLQLQQENDLLQIKDGNEKELKQLENKIAAEKRVNDLAFKDKKITREQYNQILQAIEIQGQLQLDSITEKHNAEVAKKEADFQKELAAITTKTRLAGITDSRELERVQLQIGYEEKLQDLLIRYKDDAVRFQQLKQAVDAQLKAEQDKLDAKNAKDDAKKKLQTQLKGTDGLINDPTASFKEKKAALDADVQANQDALDAKLISEQEYNENLAGFANARKEIKKQEMEIAYQGAEVVSGLFDAISEAAGKQTAAGKAFAVASATINTIESAVKSFNAFAEIPIVGPALGAVAAAAALVSGYSNVKKILAVQVPGQGSGSAATPSLSVPSAPLAPTQSSTKLDPGSVKDVGNAASARVFVLDTDVKDARERSERLNRQARLGGN